MTFQDLGLIEPILNALKQQGYENPSPIQARAIPAALAGRDVLGCAQTGTGKTCAFAAPILQRLFQTPAEGHPIRALILTPTRELAIQIQENITAYGANLPLRSTVIFGGVGQAPQVEALQTGCDILVATPGRLKDLHDQGLLSLAKIQIFVLDEADRMLDMGFIHDVRKILTWLPRRRQTLLFSATMPQEIAFLADSILHDPVRLEVDPVSSPVEAIAQSVYLVDRANKTKLLSHLILENSIPSALVFTRTKHGANRVARDLEKSGLSAAAIHGNKSQTARQAALAGFKDGSVRVLVATDIAARGLDIEDLPYVFNYNLPEVPETYVHRIGRTGRAGREGIAISLCDSEEIPLLRDIEKLLNRTLPVVENHPWPLGAAHDDAPASPKKSTAQKQGGKQPVQDLSPDSAPRQKKMKVQAVPVAGTAPQKSAPQAVARPVLTDRQETVATPEDLIAWSKDNRIIHRPERKPISALDEICPVPPDYVAPEPKYPEVKRTGSLTNEFLPELAGAPQKKKDRYLDATDRMFATRRTLSPTGELVLIPEPEARGNGRTASRSRRNAPASTSRSAGKAPAKEAAAVPSAEAGRGGRGQGGRSAAAKPAGKPARGKGASAGTSSSRPTPEPSGSERAAASAEKSTSPARKGSAHSAGKQSSTAKRDGKRAATTPASDGTAAQAGGARRRSSRRRGSSRGQTPAKGSDQQKSLMKPYYLSDREN